MYSKGGTEDKKFYCVMQGSSKLCFRLKRPQKALSEQERMTLVREFVKKMALNGELDALLEKADLRLAKKSGCLPNKYNVHHYLPLSMGGSHQEENLCIIDKKLHRWIHAYLLDPIYRDSKFDFLEDKKVYLILPPQKKVLTMNDASIFFTVEELEQIKEDELNNRVPEYLPPQVNNRDKVSILRFVEELKRDMDLFDKETKEKNEVIVENIMHRIRAENKAYRKTGKKISKFWNERREGKTRMPLTRKEKGEKSAKKARKAATRRFYPHLAVKWNQKERS